MATTKKNTTDSPKVHASLTKLRKESPAAAEDFCIALEGNKIITFPDPFAQDAEAAEEIFGGLDSGRLRPTQVLKRWLSEEDAATLFEQHPSLRDLTLIVQAAQAHFEATYGPKGEGLASRG